MSRELVEALQIAADALRDMGCAVDADEAEEVLAAHRELGDFAFAEVRHGDREVTVYKDVVIRSWGTCIDSEMSDAPRNMRTVQEAFNWLRPPASAGSGGEVMTTEAREVKRYTLMHWRDESEMDETEDGDYVRSEDYARLLSENAALRERAEGLEALLLRIGELAHRYVYAPEVNDIDRHSFLNALRRWCSEDEIADFLRDRKELIASGALSPAEPLKET